MSHVRSLPFPTTDWSAVARTGRGSDDERGQALAELLKRYLPALKSYLRAKWKLPPDRADDLLQGFLLSKVLEQHLIRRADRTRGRFRTFLMTSLDRFLVSEFRRQSAAKRSPVELVSLAEVSDPDQTLPAAPGGADPFDVAWARQVLELTLGRMRGECDAAGRAEVWGVFEARVLEPALEDAEPLPLAQLVRRFGLASPEQASNLLITAKRMFSRNLRAVVGEYAGGEGEADDEIRRLMGILGSPRMTG